MDAFWRSQLGVGYHALRHPIMAQSLFYANGQRQIWHEHEQPQLFYVTAGALKVLTSQGIWTLPPYKAIWIPSSIGHEIHAVGNVTAHSTLFEPNIVADLWKECRAVQVRGLLDGLIAALITLSEATEEPSADVMEYRGMLESFMLKVLARAENSIDGGLPLPLDRRLKIICSTLLTDPASSITLDHFADKVGASARTLARLFRSETGLSFREWRQQLRLVEAVSRLSQGEPIATISHELGYRNPSAFGAMFKRLMGMPPQRYLASNEI